VESGTLAEPLTVNTRMPLKNEATEEVAIIVKAVPQPSQRYGETVCCAGITRQGEWRRLYPIRFRRLKDKSFARWQWIRCRTARRSSDSRTETRRVSEDTIVPLRSIKASERPSFIQPLIRGSVAAAAHDGLSLTLIRPLESHFSWVRRKQDEIDVERTAYKLAARQQDLFDAGIAAIEPCPFNFRLKFRDESGWHDHHCEDWETEAAFWNISRWHGEAEALDHLDRAYNEDRPARGLVLALGNMAARPQTWLLLGIMAVPPPGPDLFA
jgi:hypothetical protein